MQCYRFFFCDIEYTDCSCRVGWWKAERTVVLLHSRVWHDEARGEATTEWSERERGEIERERGGGEADRKTARAARRI